MEDKNGYVTVIIRNNGIKHIISAPEGSNLLQLIRESGIRYTAVCGGNGRCGKCGIRLVKGLLDVTPSDELCYSADELERGMRLACRSIVKSDIEIELLYRNAEDGIVSYNIEGNNGKAPDCGVKTDTGDMNNRYGIAIDAGTTTLVLALADITGGRIMDTCTLLNPQSMYGADVISRISAATHGRAEELRQCVCKAVASGIEQLLDRNDIKAGCVDRMCMAGNTTMLHLILAYPADGLGVYPFKPHSVAMEKVNASDILTGLPESIYNDMLHDVPVTVMPGCSAYVGGDVVSGLYSLDYHKNDSICVLLDLGTNGEMAIGNSKRIMVTSAAAGPAFEGGNISCGTGSIDGAICSVDIECNMHGEKADEDDYIIKCATINDRIPVGICGTGVIDTVAELVKSGLVDETGALKEKYFDTGIMLAEGIGGNRVIFTQKDIREVQLAKAAIRSGLEILIRRYGASYEDIERLYIAGSFGYYLNTDKAAAIGMIPKQLIHKTEAVGNSSLNGALRYLCGHGKEEELCSITSIAEEITLAADEEFNEMYMTHMSF